MRLAWALNTAWMWKCRQETRRFFRAATRVAQTQHELLQQIIRRNCGTEFGHQYGFEKIKTAKDFQRCVPLGDYESHAGGIARIAAGQGNILTGERVRLLEPTSGTTNGEKLIPYTNGLRNEFQRAIATWIGDLFFHRSEVRRGRAYWSISAPLGMARRTAGGIPIGFDDDTAYLSSWERRFVRKLLAVPPSIATSADVETFRYQTLLHLLAAHELALISIWSPTFLTSLLAPLDDCLDRLLNDLRRGTDELQPNVRRADELQTVFDSHETRAEQLRMVWPRLALLSCWADAASTTLLPAARFLLPHVEVQPKGLISTEAFVSVPLCDRPGAALAIRSHFFEFKEVDSEQCRFAHELESGGRYQVVVTTSGGLYRYQLCDQVTVTGFLNDCPLLRFAGRTNSVSDMVGEKLHEAHVRRVLDSVLRNLQIVPTFAMLVPVMVGTPHYRLYLQARNSAVDLDQVVELLERGLRENPHYRLATGLGQLAPVDAQGPKPHQSFWSIYERRRMTDGLKPGDIKPTVLDAWHGWNEVFSPTHRPAIGYTSAARSAAGT